MGLLQILTYVSGLVFVGAFAAKILKYFSMPMHVRWELYPVPHEGKPWGGSFFEDVDYWKKTRHKDHLAQYKFMVPEILFIRALHEDNRSLWYWSLPFHLGLYLGIGGLVTLTMGAALQVWELTPDASAPASMLQALTTVLAVTGYVLGTIGSLGLFIKRLTDRELSEFSAGIDYLNLVWLAAIFGTGFFVWLSDPGFTVSRQFLVGLMTFSAPGVSLTTIHTVNLLLFISFFAYFPFTHMTHMVSKYFMWDKVKWDDDPNVGDPAMDNKIKEYLGYPVTWAGPHIGAEGGKKSWAQVATSNPWAKETK